MGTLSDVTELLKTHENLTSGGDAMTLQVTFKIWPKGVASTFPGSSAWAQTGASEIKYKFLN